MAVFGCKKTVFGRIRAKSYQLIHTTKKERKWVRFQLNKWISLAWKDLKERASRVKFAQLVLKFCRYSVDLKSGIIHVKDSLNFQHCSRSLVSLPGFIHYDGDLDLSWSGIRFLPEGLVVGGELNLSGSKIITTPRNLVVQETLTLSGCQRLTKINEINVGLHLIAERCEYLVELPQNLNISGDLILRGCSSLLRLPSRLTVGLELCLDDCTNLDMLSSDYLHIGANLLASRCTNLKNMGNEIIIGGDLEMRECNSLEHLCDALVVGYNVDLSKCEKLTSFGCENLKLISGNLNLSGCKDLHTLIDDLVVEQELDLSGCTSISSISPNLRAGSINLRNCTQLVTLPDDLVFSETLNIENCVNITDISYSLLTQNDFARVIYLHGSGITVAPSSPSLNNIHFVLTPSFHGEEEFETLDEAIKFWTELIDDKKNNNYYYHQEPQQQQQREEEGDENETNNKQNDEKIHDNDDFIPNEHKRGVLLFLSMLRGSKEFEDENTQVALAKRIVEVFETIKKYPQIKEELLSRMTDSVDACHDKPIWALNQMSLVTKIAMARGNRDELLKVGKGVMRLGIVHEHAKKKINKLGQGVDDVCVYLKFEIALREVLNLPVSAQDMIYPIVKVSKRELKACETEALKVSEKSFQNWLKIWPEWERQLRYEYATDPENGWENVIPCSKHVVYNENIHFNLLGERVFDPVCWDENINEIWSYSELVKHWINTGMDFTNNLRTIQNLQTKLKRVHFLVDQSPIIA